MTLGERMALNPASSEPRVRLLLRVTLGYGLLIAIALGIFAWICSVGAGLAAPAPAYLLPPSIAPVLGIIAQVGVIIYIFLVGLQLDPTYLRRSPYAALSISHASIIFPFLLGSSLAIFLYPAFLEQ
jgi:Kef-type K+ transport system membrane component KefB